MLSCFPARQLLGRHSQPHRTSRNKLNFSGASSFHGGKNTETSLSCGNVLKPACFAILHGALCEPPPMRAKAAGSRSPRQEHGQTRGIAMPGILTRTGPKPAGTTHSLLGQPQSLGKADRGTSSRTCQRSCNYHLK